MARKAILDTYYTFNPATKTIVIPRAIPQERVVLITNVTRNIVLYNFSDATLKSNSHTITTFSNNNNTVTTIVLNRDTTSHSANDKLQITIDEYEETFKPSELLTDPVNKLRISQPQALIDTDFEYGQQATKWETVSLINNRPYAYGVTSNVIAVSNITMTNGSRVVTIATTTPPAVGTPIYIQDSLYAGADGLFVVDGVSAGTSFAYTAKYPFTGTSNVSLYDATATVVSAGTAFSNANITIQSMTNVGTNVTCFTSNTHGLSVGNEIALYGATGTNAPNGSWVITGVTANNSFNFNVVTAPSGGITTTNAFLYTRPIGSSFHRAFDGGVQFTTNAASHNQQLIRQTRRYFRYQSGKGIQMSTGSILKPNINIDQISNLSGTTCRIVTKQPHNVNPGVTITIAGCNESAYNGTFTVLHVLDPYTFTYLANTTPSATPASGTYYLSVSSWYGATNRVGMFDNQNGIFFEFDGQTLSAVKRSSTYQLSGWGSVTANSPIVTGATYNGVSTQFTKQLSPGDWIVIKGMSYRVIDIYSDTQLSISPAYRGVTAPQVIISKTVDTKIPQSQWNIDRLDGTGPSGYNLDLTKMQMFYLDYSWYGAGFIRWGMRASSGDVVYCHKLINNNANYEAYMRSGNLPGRYETATFSKTTTLAANVGISDAVIALTDATGWPPSGTAMVRNATATEYVTYNGISANVLQQVTRGQGGANMTGAITSGNAIVNINTSAGLQKGQLISGSGIPSNAFVVDFTGTTLTMSQGATSTGTGVLLVTNPLGLTAQTWIKIGNTNPVAVELHAPQFAPTISHWGTSVIMDGRYDDDKSFVFTRGTTTPLIIQPNQNAAILSFRIAPTVNNGITSSSLGARELINRMQMVLRQVDAFTNGSYLITLVLNGTVSNAAPSWQSMGGSSLAQYITHSANTTLTGGETLYGFFLNGSGSNTSYTATTTDLNLVRDLGSSILGGGNTLPTLYYPDGPDIVTVMAQNVSTTSNSNIFVRLSWTEAQA